MGTPVPALQMGKLRHGQVEEPIRDHRGWSSLDLKLGLTHSRACTRPVSPTALVGSVLVVRLPGPSRVLGAPNSMKRALPLWAWLRPGAIHCPLHDAHLRACAPGGRSVLGRLL